MDMHITARHFKAHETLRSYAFRAINKLEDHFDGIISAKLILSYEKSLNSVKAAELIVKIQGAVLKSVVKAPEYQKSIDTAVEKIERQLQKHKAKKREKRKASPRTAASKV